MVQSPENYDESCGYAVGGAYDSSSDCLPYDVDPSGDDMYANSNNVDYPVNETSMETPEFCDMCGMQLPLSSNVDLREQHIKVSFICNLSTFFLVMSSSSIATWYF